MRFRQSHQFRVDLEEALSYYLEIDRDLAAGILDELKTMETHLADFPEASPLISVPPIRKYLLKRFPYRVRYAYSDGEILLLTLEKI